MKVKKIHNKVTANHTDYMSLKALYELQQLRDEMKKDKPDTDRIFELISGTKYNKPIKK
jgi:hypothetical protein